MNLYEELVWRGMVKDVSNEEAAKNLLNNQKVSFYCGFDPTGDSLTIGHIVQVVRMLLLQQHGHKPVVLVGGATGLIGDPRETTERKLLTLEQSLKNAKSIEKQLAHFLKDNVLFVNNYDWISKIDMISFLRDYGKHFNINYMLAKDTVAKRLDTGISYTEFSYMIIQAIDWLHLYENHNVKIQFGGSDQWGNITAGLELMRKVKGENGAVALSSPLLVKSDGKKFGKSESGALWIDKNMTSPYELYQYFLNTADDDLENYFKLLTLLDRKETESILKSHQKDQSKRIAQKRLSEEVVILIHGHDALKEAQDVTSALFTGSFDKLSKGAFKTLEKVLDVIRIDDDFKMVELLVQSNLASSNREAREFIQNGAVFVNQQKVVDLNQNISEFDKLFEKYLILRRGKKKYALIVF